jgi:hypothetical protein
LVRSIIKFQLSIEFLFLRRANPRDRIGLPFLFIEGNAGNFEIFSGAASHS